MKRSKPIRARQQQQQQARMQTYQFEKALAQQLYKEFPCDGRERHSIVLGKGDEPLKLTVWDQESQSWFEFSVASAAYSLPPTTLVKQLKQMVVDAGPPLDVVINEVEGIIAGDEEE